MLDQLLNKHLQLPGALPVGRDWRASVRLIAVIPGSRNRPAKRQRRAGGVATKRSSAVRGPAPADRRRCDGAPSPGSQVKAIVRAAAIRRTRSRSWPPRLRAAPLLRAESSHRGERDPVAPSVGDQWLGDVSCASGRCSFRAERDRVHASQVLSAGLSDLATTRTRCGGRRRATRVRRAPGSGLRARAHPRR
jgi:hypothetical protein